jgi:hypothetical protein
VLAATVVPGATATAHALAETHAVQAQGPIFSDIRAAVAQARTLAGPGDLAIVRTDRHPQFWYGESWRYYMNGYQGYPASVARLPAVAASDTISVFRVTPAAVDSFLAAHPRSRVVFLMELAVPRGFPVALHEQALRSLRRFGYCPVRTFVYPVTGHLTVLDKGRCRRGR